MKHTVLKVLAALLAIIFIDGLTRLDASAQTKAASRSSGRIVYVDQAKGFVVLNLGKEDGVKKGRTFDIYHQGVKIGVVKLIKIRQKFSAADIEYTYRNQTIEVGDTVKLSGKTHPAKAKAACALAPRKEKSLQERVDGMFAQAQQYLRNEQYKLAEEKVQAILQLDPKNKAALEMLSKIREESLQWVMDVEPKIFTVDINAPKQVIHSTAIDVLKKFGCLVTFADPLKYNLEASKYINLPLAKDIASDYGPYTKCKIYYTVEIVEIKEAASFESYFANRLIIYLKETFDEEGKVSYHQIQEDADIYKEAQKLVTTIKSLAEEL